MAHVQPAGPEPMMTIFSGMGPTDSRRWTPPVPMSRPPETGPPVRRPLSARQDVLNAQPMGLRQWRQVGRREVADLQRLIVGDLRLASYWLAAEDSGEV